MTLCRSGVGEEGGRGGRRGEKGEGGGVKRGEEGGEGRGRRGEEGEEGGEGRGRRGEEGRCGEVGYFTDVVQRGMVYSHRCTCSCTARGDCTKYQLRASLQDGSVRKGEQNKLSLPIKLSGTLFTSLIPALNNLCNV